MELNEQTSIADIVSQEDLIQKLERDLTVRALPYLVASVKKAHSPIVKITSIKRDKALDKVEVKSITKEVVSRTVKSVYTIEALEDLYYTYGEDLVEVLSMHLGEEVSEEMNTDLITFLDANATLGDDINFNPSDLKSTSDVIFNIKVKINTEVMRIAQANKRPLRGFAIVSPLIASAITVDGYDNIGFDKNNEIGDNQYLGTFGAIDYYVNYDHAVAIDKVYVGLVAGNTNGSLIYSPYTNMFFSTVEESSGQPRYHILNRSLLSLNPFDVGTGANDSSFLTSFNIDLTAFTDY